MSIEKRDAVMIGNEWDANNIFLALCAPRTHNFLSDITVLKIDEELQVVMGYNDNGCAFLGFPQIGEMPGFKKGRANLEVSQTIDLKERGLIEPALALSFLVNSEEELRAISTIFAGLYDLNKNARGTEKASLAAQGFEEYFADLPKISPARELEIGLFGELSVIAASTKKMELVKGWHSAPDSTYDFSYNGNRLEVKTSTRPTRLIWLRSSQTLQNPDPKLTYLSIYAPIDEGGLNIQELIDQIRASLNPSLRTKFDEKLSFYDLNSCEQKFDFQKTKESFRFIDSADVPLPSFEDTRILEVRWKCNFDNLADRADSSFWV